MKRNEPDHPERCAKQDDARPRPGPSRLNPECAVEGNMKTITWAILFIVVAILQSPSLSAVNWGG